MKFIDLRSDTVTQPTKEMRQAMLTCEVGDDVYQDDPTVNQLEALASEITGKEAALFVPTGTMGNQIAIMTHTHRGDEIIVGKNCHIVSHEVGAPATLSGVSTRTIDSENDILLPEQIKHAIRQPDIHHPTTSLICLENALSNGKILSVGYMKEIYNIAQENNLSVHTDGARLFNASVALEIDVQEICQYTDSVMFCLSKGLCAPVGSILAGKKDFIYRARKNRKLLGGGMRQAGVLATTGIVALTQMVGRLGEDHRNAQYFAQSLSEIDVIEVLQNNLDINMIFFKIKQAEEKQLEFVKYLLRHGIKVNEPEDGVMRFVTHNDVSKEDITETISVIRAFFELKI